MAYGNVYVFNLYTESASLTDLNGQGSPGGPIAPPAKGAGPYWVPQQAGPIGRTNLELTQLSSPLFVNRGGSLDQFNTLSVNYGGQAWRVHLTIPDPPDPNLESDLWVYLAYQQAFLFNAVDGSLIPPPGPGDAFKVETVDY
jgi:hypothetical protein